MTNLVALMGILLFLTGCNPEGKTKSVSASATPVDTSLPTRWSTNSSGKFPIAIKVDPYFNSTFGGILAQFENSADQWDAEITDINLIANTFTQRGSNFAAGTGSRSSHYDNEMGIYYSENWFDDVSSNALAITQYYSSVKLSGTANAYNDLVHADIIVNEKNFNFRSTETGATKTYDLVTVVLHELGHFVGLGHIAFSSAVMAPSLGPTDHKRTLNTYDKNATRDLYEDFNSIALEASALVAEDSNPLIEESQQLNVGVIELRTDGSCHHYVNGKLVEIMVHPGLADKLLIKQ